MPFRLYCFFGGSGVDFFVLVYAGLIADGAAGLAGRLTAGYAFSASDFVVLDKCLFYYGGDMLHKMPPNGFHNHYT
jgi:hypothetical protein